jgi:hypothetical protein
VTPNTPFGVAPLDIIFGYQPAILDGQKFQRHRTMFTQLTMAGHLEAAGFTDGTVSTHAWQLFAKAVKGVTDGEESTG